ncbi:tetratricopeptide repeat protein [Lutibacter sp.]|uniref:tetratricopeptide repeat protein n=1 Tax=Lutibacter sp. TaxID=1925666 RepID=UPI003563D0F9
MKNKNLHLLFLIGIVLISNFSYAQINIAEENNLKFQTHFFEALKQKAIKNYSKAIENLEKCYEIDSLNMAVHFELSKNKLELHNYFEAEFFINKALMSDSNNCYLLEQKVAVFLEQQNFNKAIETQKKIVALQPKYSDKLILLYIQNKDFKKAEELIVEIEENALSTQRIKGFKKYLESRETLNIIKDIEEDIAISSIDIEGLKEKYKQNKEYKMIQEILNKEVENELFNDLYLDSKNALELFPAQPYLYKMNGFALNKLGKYNEAKDVLTLGIDFVIDNAIMEADFYEQFSIAYEGLKQIKEALKYKQKAEILRRNN